MLYLTCNTMPSADLARYGVSRVKNLGTWEMCHKNVILYHFPRRIIRIARPSIFAVNKGKKLWSAL